MQRLEPNELAAELRGEVFAPGDAGYDETCALWNGMIAKRPALVARVADADDVPGALAFARRHDLRVSVRAGGHNVAGRALNDGGLVLDVSAMKGIEVDPSARLAHVQPGVVWGELDEATQAHGLATTGGVDSRTGVAGLTLGGGIGYLARRFGLAIDNLVEAEVVLADGETLTVDDERHPELFWALRGGGGRVGVVTRFTFRLHPVGPEVVTAQAWHRIEDAGPVLRSYRAAMETAPDDLAVYAMILHVPPIAPFAEELHGRVALALVACHSGPAERATAEAEEIAALGRPFLKDVRPTPYVEQQRAFDAGTPDGARYYYKTHVMPDLTDAAIDTLLAGLGDLPGPLTIIGIEPLGGAIARVAPDATAFPHRAARFDLGVWAGWTDPADDERCIGWAHALHDALRPHASGGAYLNYQDRDDLPRRDAAFGENVERLRRIETRYDPDGLFRPRPVPA